jgi:alpha-tubulin suppressor-like RCC1 family protein
MMHTLPTQIWIDVELYKRRISMVSAGDTHTAALVDDGYVYTWGSAYNSTIHYKTNN